jgi:solute carrier family 13 (sodium-dependent dicarboxylate transporter), member 2/3/5
MGELHAIPAASDDADESLPPQTWASNPDPEARLLRLRTISGLILAPIAFVTVLALPLGSLKPAAHRLAAVMAAVIVLWVTEALPLPLTALIGAAACVLLQVASAREVFLPFADPLIFMFIGAFILARALFVHRLDRRLAFGILSLPWIGGRPARILFAFGAVTAFISAWVANAATTAMMYAIAMSIINYLFDPRRPGGPLASRSYAIGLLLMTTFAASVGGLATPVGAAPNMIGLGFIRDVLGIEFSFLAWCVVGVPAAVALFLYVAAYLGLLCRAGCREIAGGQDLFLAERSKLGPWTAGQRSTCIACALTVGLWLAPAALALVVGEASSAYRLFDESVPEPIAALVGAALLFLLPGDRGRRAIDWEEAARIDWGIILIFGGGLSLGVLGSQTGLAQAVGRGLAAAVPTHSTLGLVALATVTAALVSEVTSNTASATMVVPVVIGVAQAAGVDPLQPALGATLGSGLGFMLPVSTPCNAIVYSSGRVPLRTMMAYGLLLDIVGVVVIIAAVHLLTPLVH